ncbi:uncharacterized protein K02A2.6-like [Octopus bimaculoides]|uniref:uncharacterized protein K02A2.6-like n=1 Tax=Octopus bimaculoides TaxID=37653 RepID=UPI0022E25F38|nr:uncharacterized protein K02A2.6-like [Octopus bimaculoides]
MWAAPTVHRKRIIKSECADFSTGLNECLKRYLYPQPSPEGIFAKLNSGKIFSKLDLPGAYLQIKVEDECSKYLTINTHNRLPFGKKVAAAIFQQIMDAMLVDCEFAIPYLDDILFKCGSRD